MRNNSITTYFRWAKWKTWTTQTNKQTECTVSASHKSFLKWFRGVGSLKKKAIINSTIQQSMPSPFCPKPVSRHKQTNKQTNKQTECTVSVSHKSFLKWFKGVGSLKKKAIINSTIQQSMPSPFCPKPVSLAPCMIVGWDCFWLLLCFKSCLYFLGDSSFLPTELNCKGTFLIGRMQLTKTCLRMAQIWSSLKKKKRGIWRGHFSSLSRV